MRYPLLYFLQLVFMEHYIVRANYEIPCFFLQLVFMEHYIVTDSFEIPVVIF